MPSASVVLVDEMAAHRLKYPNRLSEVEVAGFGVVNVYGTDREASVWWQLRRYHRRSFQLSGGGPRPTPDVLDAWAAIDADLDGHVKEWLDEVARLTARPLGEESYPVELGYLNCIRANLNKNSLTLSAIKFGRPEFGHVAVFEFPEHWDYYVWPFVEFTGRTILGSLFSM